MNATARRAALLSLVSGEGIVPAKASTLALASAYFDLAGEEFGRRLLLTTGADGVQYCLRPDFTLPIARSHIKSGGNTSLTYGYLGPVFRQRETGPAEFEQAGLELLAQPDAELALATVFDFTKSALAIFGAHRPAIRLGSVALFEALLGAADMPAVWRPRLRRRFGSKKAMGDLLARLADPHQPSGNATNLSRNRLVEQITGQMLANGLSLIESRQPEEIADRYLEKQVLAAAKVPEKTLELFNDYLAISGGVKDALNQVRALFSSHDISLEPHLDQVQRHAGALTSAFPDAPVVPLVFDAGFSPRLHYYTGLVFEMSNQSGEILASGGQYDRLLQALGAKNQISACGCAVWVDRLENEVAP